MSQEIEEIKRILLNYDSTIKERLETGLDESKSLYELEEFLNEFFNKLTEYDMLDLVLVIEQFENYRKKRFKMLSNN